MQAVTPDEVRLARRSDLCRQFIKQAPGFLEVRGIEPFGEPGIYRRQQPAGLSPPALRTPQTRQACAATQLMAFRILATGDSESAAKTGVSLGRGCSAALHQQGSIRSF